MSETFGKIMRETIKLTAAARDQVGEDGQQNLVKINKNLEDLSDIQSDLFEQSMRMHHFIQGLERVGAAEKTALDSYVRWARHEKAFQVKRMIDRNSWQ